MTSINLENFKEQEKVHKTKVDEFTLWCAEHRKIGLAHWMEQNGALSQDLLLAELISYQNPEYLPVSMSIFYLPTLTARGRELIAPFPEADSSCDLDVELAYVIDDEELHRVLEKHIKKSAEERRVDFRYEYRVRHGSEAPPIDDELPLRYRSYVGGPFCELDEAQPVPQEKRHDHFCHWCGTLLRGKPRLSVAANVLCFKCSKLAYFRLRPLAEKLNGHGKLREIWEIQALEEWRRDLSYHVRRKSIFTSIAELFHGDKDAYVKRFTESNPEPSVRPHKDVSPSLMLILDCSPSSVSRRAEILRRDESTCQLCGWNADFGRKDILEVHHILPKAEGGKDYCSNLITLCIGCHNDEDWFGHQRAFKDLSFESFGIEWDWEIRPDILSNDEESLIACAILFEGEKISQSAS